MKKKKKAPPQDSVEIYERKFYNHVLANPVRYVAWCSELTSFILTSRSILCLQVTCDYGHYHTLSVYPIETFHSFLHVTHFVGDLNFHIVSVLSESCPRAVLHLHEFSFSFQNKMKVHQRNFQFYEQEFDNKVTMNV